mmetsp:Transcript_31102/g.88813  ORF Transcript_31102/g.88813 Transcript_31102/m.88813 type:complete len:215 (+) Transcript_31102:1187-1831(+)
MVFDLFGGRRHLLAPTIVANLQVPMRFHQILVLHRNGGVGRHNRQLSQILHNSGFICTEISRNEYLQLGPQPLFDRIRVFLVRHNNGDVLGNVNVQSASRILRRNGSASLGSVRRGDFNGNTRALFAPDQSHFGAQAEFASRLANTVLAATQDAAQQVGDLVVAHAAAVVANGNAKVAFGRPLGLLGASRVAAVASTNTTAAFALKELHVFGPH